MYYAHAYLCISGNAFIQFLFSVSWQRYDEEDSIGTVEHIATWINNVLGDKHETFVSVYQ